MGNLLEKLDSSQNPLKNDSIASQTQDKTQSQDNPTPKSLSLQISRQNIEKHIDLQLETVLKNFPLRWRHYCFGIFEDVDRTEDISITEFEAIVGSMKERIQTLHVIPSDGMNFEVIGIKNTTDATLHSYGIKLEKYFHGLQKFTISGLFIDPQKLTSNGIESFVLKAARHLTSLHHLTINLNGRLMTDHMLKMISTEIAKGLINLRSIKIDVFLCPKVIDRGLGLLLSGLNRYATRLTKLELFGLDFYDDKKLARIGENLHRNLRNLSHFTLKIQNNGDTPKITNQGLQILGASIGRYLTKLEHLTFLFWDLKQITDKSVEALLSNICSSISSLKTISITFDCCSAISSVSFSAILKILSQTQNDLKMISISFICINYKSNDTITPSTFKVLDSMKKGGFENIESLRLDFTSCKNMDNEALMVLSSWIKKQLNKLRSLFLEISYCKKISKFYENKAKKELNFIHNLQIVNHS